MAATRTATAVWEGDLARGKGQVSATSSETFKDLGVSWVTRTEQPTDGRTSPEELLAAAHASCYCMALSGGLGRGGNPPETLTATASVTFDKVGESWSVVSSAIEVRGKVPGIDQEAFQKAAEGARDGCPISRALKGNVELSVKATLEQ
jgi:osmotically inducible protein OsmC